MRSRTSFRVSFFLKKHKLLKNGEAAVSMRITVDGQRAENNIRKSILPSLWGQSKERAKGTSKTATDLNRFIEDARVRIHQISFIGKRRKIQEYNITDVQSYTDI